MTFFDELASVPEEMKQFPNWVCYRKVPKENKPGEFTKPPINPRTGGGASSTNPETWTDFKTAVEAAKRMNLDGVGFMFSNSPFFGVDIDHKPQEIRDYLNGDDSGLIAEFVEILRTYAEISPSGNGLHFICRGELPPGSRRRGDFEMYDSGRFFTVTGNTIGDYTDIAECGEAVKPLYAKYIAAPAEQTQPETTPAGEAAPEEPPTPAPEAGETKTTEKREAAPVLSFSADELIEKALNAANGDKFSALFSGDCGNKSHSQADLALCDILAYWTGKNAELMDEIFRRSGLMRDKWDRKTGNSTYGAITIQKAINDCKKVYEPRTRRNSNTWRGNSGAANAAKAFSAESSGSSNAPTWAAGKSETVVPTDFTDVGQARMLVKLYKGKARHSPATGWLIYDGVKWAEDDIQARGLAHELTDRQIREAGARMKAAHAAKENAEDAAASEAADNQEKQARLILNHAYNYRKSSKISATLTEATPRAAIDVAELDKDPFILNTPKGELNLKTGELKPHNPESFLTKCTAVSVSEQGRELWLEFLEKLCCGDKALERYLQTIAGMAAIGKVYSECLIIATGKGGNGKSTFFNALAGVLGNYAGRLNTEVLITSSGKNKAVDYAALRGKRLVIAAELDEGKRLDTGIVKKLASTDPIAAEPKYKAPFSFIPSHSIVLYTNHLPKVGSNDSGTWDRLQVVPFNARFRNTGGEIKNYADYLIEHAGGFILSWVAEGARMFYEAGFKITAPEAVQQTTDTYKGENDWFTNYFDECCIADNVIQTSMSMLYTAYRYYCKENGEFIRTKAEFRREVEARGYELRRLSAGVMCRGISLRQPEQPKIWKGEMA